MQMKKLHIEAPPIIGYLHHAYLLTVAQEHPSFEQWFNCNYIQLIYYPDRSWLNFYRFELAGAFAYCPLVDVQQLKPETVKINNLDLIDFAVSCINQNCYVWLFTDEYYDPARRAYQTEHLIHENLLYGYNLDEGCFYTAGYGLRGKYVFSEISFCNFMNGFNSSNVNYPIKILKPLDIITYKFDIENAKNLLTDYANSKNTSERSRIINNPTSDCVYGMDIYNHLKAYFKGLPDTPDVFSDIRMLHIFWEHKKCITSRIKYMYENKYIDNADSIINAYSDMENKTLMLRGLQLKYNLKHDVNLIRKIISMLDEMKTEEEYLLNRLLELLA